MHIYQKDMKTIQNQKKGIPLKKTIKMSSFFFLLNLHFKCNLSIKDDILM